MQKLPKGFSLRSKPSITIGILYDTDIVTVDHKADTFTLDSGGWSTNHTKKCMNLVIQPLGYTVYQKDSTWYVKTKDKVMKYHEGYPYKI
jgi:hypothetical protein